MYKGNYLLRNRPILEKDGNPNLFLMGIINALTDRVFTDVYLTVGVPAAGLGMVGDMAINTSTWTPYTKTDATTWTAGAAIDNNANAFLLISSKR